MSESIETRTIIGFNLDPLELRIFRIKIIFNCEKDVILWIDLRLSDNSNTNKKSETKPDPEGSTEGESVDQLKKELGKATKKIEKMEEKIDDQQEAIELIKSYKSEGITLVLAIAVGLLGFMGAGHIYLGRVKRGIIIIIVGGLLILTSFFIPVVLLMIFGEEGETSDPTGIIGVMGGFVVGGIGIFALFIWQIFNSRKLCKEYNRYLEQHNGRPPW